MNIKSRLLAWVFLLLLPVVSQAKNTVLPSVELDRLLSGMKTFQAAFSQITISENNQRLQTSSGILQFERPEKFRFETLKPSHQIVITDGKSLWTYDVALKQATRQKVQPDMLTPASVLSGNTMKLLRQFKITLSDLGNRKQFVLIANDQNTNFKEVMIYFVSNQLTSLTVVNQLGQKNRFDFSDVKVNNPLDKTLFTFTAPKGVDVLQSK